MSIHMWGDENFDWRSLDLAVSFIDKGLRRWKINVFQSKEKFGEARIYCSLGLSSFEQLLRPGWAYSQWPKWLRGLDYSWVARVVRRCLNLAIMPLHRWAYRRCYRMAVEQWPHIHDEILDAADWSEFLRGL